MPLKMQTVISVLKGALAIRRRAFVTEDDGSCDRSLIRSTVIAKIKLLDMMNDRQTIESTDFIIQAGNIEEHSAYEI